MKQVAIGVHLFREDVEPLAAAVPIGNLFVSAMSVDEDQPLGDRDLLLRVADLRARLLERATFVAVRYGFAFRTAAEAASKCAPYLEAWSKTLRQNRHRVEMSLKVAAVASSARPDRHTFDKGADYLRALHAAKEAVHVDSAFRAEVEKRIAPLCSKWKWVARDAASLEFCGLIDRDKLEELSRAGQAIKAAQPDVPFLLSAPWPLEVFTDVDYE